MKQKKTKKNRFPDFDKMSHKEEAQWWETHSLADYQDELKTIEAKFVKPRSTVLSVRLEQDTASQLRLIARKKGLGATTLIRMWVREQLEKTKGHPQAA